MAGVSRTAKTFTPKQGQYLAFITLYTRLHRGPDASGPVVGAGVLSLGVAAFARVLRSMRVVDAADTPQTWAAPVPQTAAWPSTR